MSVPVRLLSLACGLAIAVTCATASAAQAPGTLSPVEYQTVHTEVQLVSTLSTRSSPAHVHSVVAHCWLQSGATALLRAERFNCAAVAGAIGSEVGLFKVEAKCRRTPSATRLHCLVPGYVAVRDGFVTLHHAGLLLDHAVATRHFTSDCESALGDQPHEVAKEVPLIRELDNLVLELRENRSVAFLETTGRFVTSAANLSAAGKQYPLSVCPRSSAPAG